MLDTSPLAAAPRLSSPSKMPCLSWSLPAVVTCFGSIAPDGQLVPACSKCYAAQGRYLLEAVRDVREHNLEDWQRPGWADAMVAALDADRMRSFRAHIRRAPAASFRHFFRWFDSGDIYRVELARQILDVCRRTPETRHWIPTRARKDPQIATVLAELERLPNVVVRHSSDGVQGEVLDGFANTSTIVPDASQFAPGRGRIVCGSAGRDGQCGPCRACWSPLIATVAYPAHGRAVAAVTLERLLPQRSALLG
jgi:hypothetical protein